MHDFATPEDGRIGTLFRLMLALFGGALLFTGCASIVTRPFGGGSSGARGTGAATARPHSREIRSDDLSPVQQRVVDSAKSLVGARTLRINGRRFRYDCTGTILAAYYGAGIDLEAEFSAYTGNGVARLFKLAAAHELVYSGDSPRPGDVIFWDNTYDRNGDGTWNDPLTHAGVVIRTYEDGSVEYVHHNYREGIVVARMSLASPDLHQSGALLVNSPMRMNSHRYINPSRWLASHLYRSAGMLYEL